MALTPAERKRLQRERDKARAAQTAIDVDAALKKPFSEWLNDQRWANVLEGLYLAGLDIEVPFPGEGDIDSFWKSEWGEGPNRGSIGAAERMVGVFLDAAVQMASYINDYKTEEIGWRIDELEDADLSDPAAKKQALADIVKLTKYRDQLEKQVRWSLPQWKVKGE